MADTKGTSPYSRHNKKPHRYSTLYQEWQAALKSGNTELANSLAKKHTIKYFTSKDEQLKMVS